jgi:hypothetical protein
MFLIEEKAQLSVEFLLILSLVIVTICCTIPLILNENELNIIMSSARTGVEDGIAINGISVYPKETFNDYLLKNPQLTYSHEIKFLKILKNNMGFDGAYDKQRIQLKVYASSSYLNIADKNGAGDRINYCIRKSIATTFKTENLSNALYNPSFSNNYVITTADVQWV